MPMPGQPGFGTGPDLRKMAAKQRAIDTRRRILQPDEAPRFQGSGPGIAPRARTRAAPFYSAQAQGQGTPGGGWGLSDVLQGPGNFVRDTLGDKAMNIIRNVGPPLPGLQLAYQGTRLLPGGAGDTIREGFGDVVTDPYSYLGFGGAGAAGRGLMAGRRGLNFAERLLSRIPKAQRATSDRGPATVQSMLADIDPRLSSNISGGMYGTPPLGRLSRADRRAAMRAGHTYEGSAPWPPGVSRERAAWQGGTMEESTDRFQLEELARGKTIYEGGGDAPGIQMANEFPENWYGITKPRQPSRMSPQDEEELRLAMAHDDPSVIDEMMQGGLGTPQMGGRMPEEDRLARMLLEELGGRRPQQVFRDPIAASLYPEGFSMQGNVAGPLAAMGAAGGYGWQRRQQASPRTVTRQLRRRLPYMLSDNWR